MSQAPIREYSGKRLIHSWMEKHDVRKEFKTIGEMVLITPKTDMSSLESPFKPNTKLVGKPDQLVKRRGKLGLVSLNKSFNDTLNWIKTKRNNELTIKTATDTLEYFLIEPFIKHTQNEELYICIHSVRDGDEILFYKEGGVDVGDVDAKALRMIVKPMETPKINTIIKVLLKDIQPKKSSFIAEFIQTIHKCYAELHFAYLEINPLVVLNDLSAVYVLDLAAKLDQCAEFQCHSSWGDIVTFPPYFGHKATTEEQFVHELDERTGASLKLTVLNEKARIWTMVAGGGASVIYADTICDLGFGKELGNYGEYSGSPTKTATYEYAVTIIKLLLKNPLSDNELNDGKSKVLIIGGGIANFTDVADTFLGIIEALKEFQDQLKAQKTKIYVRRGGPNYQTGLKNMKACGDECGFDMKVFGPETHITGIVSMALLNTDNNDKHTIQSNNYEAMIDNLDLNKYKWNDSWEDKNDEDFKDDNASDSDSFPVSPSKSDNNSFSSKIPSQINKLNKIDTSKPYVMTSETKSIVYGMQAKAVQNMLDFDYICRRKRPSVQCIVYSFASGIHHRQFYWGSKEIMIPVYKKLSDALEKYKKVDTIVNFASSRSAYNATLEMLNFKQIRHITIIAEGVPERYVKDLMIRAKESNTIILGPSTVGGLKPGCFRIGNTGGMLDNIVSCGLYQPGSIAFVSRSGGLSNELSNIISRCTNGVLEGMAIGGDRYPLTTFMDHLIRYQKDPNCKFMVLLGEVGGILEYDVIKAIKDGILTKPIIAWCTGTCATSFTHEVQFGHAGAMAQSVLETAAEKNKQLAKAGCLVPESFDDFDKLIKLLYQRLVKDTVIKPAKKVEPPPVPVDYSWARKLGMVRKPAGFLSGITDERGEELVYAGMPISKIFKDNLGIGGVIGLLWFRRKLPDYFTKFIEISLMITADHGPAVSGAHNTIVTARAGKDLISSLCSGLLTIGPRFGGALDGAAKMFTSAFDDGLSPTEFVKQTRKKGKLILGIGHKIKSLENPDKRVEIIVNYAKNNFPKNTILNYALEVQKVTTRKKSNLILNVDGAIAVCFVDLLRYCGEFNKQEADLYVNMGSLNALFVLGRSIGFIGHFLDQTRLGQGLYRHPTDDITYFLHDLNANQ